MLKISPFGLATLLLALIASCNPKQQPKEETSQTVTPLDTLKSPRDFYPKERAQVLVVGSFHFEYPGLDKHKAKDDNKIDVLEEPKKSELKALTDYITKFKPNKVAIEARPKWNTMEKYRGYRNGKYTDKRDERYTIAMQVASNMGLDTLYAVDTNSLLDDLFKKDSMLVKSLTNKIDWDAPDPYWDMATGYLDYKDAVIPNMHLLDYFKYMNSVEAHRANYGLYLTGTMGKADGQTADNLSMWWYNRNLRIFSKLVGLTEGPEDRIMVVMGNGHASLLRHLFEASPQYDFVEFSSLDE